MSTKIWVFFRCVGAHGVRLALTAMVVSQFLTVGALAQAPPAPEAFDERLDVRLVQVDFLATDKAGRPITDLEPSDVVVKESGKAREIVVFERHQAMAPTQVSDARLHFEAPDGRRPWHRVGRQGRRLIFLFDLVHGDLKTRGEVKAAALDFLGGRLSPEDRVAVALFDGSVQWVQGFTSDGAELRAAVEQAFAKRAPTVATEARMRELLLMLRDCQKQAVAQQRFEPGRECFAGAARQYVQEVEGLSAQLLVGLDTLARLLAGAEGRKLLFLFSHGVSLGAGDEAVEAIEAVAGSNVQVAELRYELTRGADPRRDLAAVVERASRAGVTILALDATSAPTGDLGVEERVRLRRTARPYSIAYRQARDALGELAAGTGGLFLGSGDVLADLDRAVDATRGSYTLGYYRGPGVQAKGGGFLEIKLASRRKGVKLASRRGRYHEPAPVSARLGRLELAAQEPREGRALTPFAIILDPLAFDLVEGEHEMALHLTLELRLSTAAGAQIADSFHLLAHTFPRQAWQGGTVVAPRYEGLLELPPGDYVFSVLLRDPRHDTHAKLNESIRVSPILASQAVVSSGD